MPVTEANSDPCIHGVEQPDLCCAICRETPAVAADGDAELVRSFTAKYDGHCDSCGRPIKVDDDIGLWDDDTYRHTTCPTNGHPS